MVSKPNGTVTRSPHPCMQHPIRAAATIKMFMHTSYALSDLKSLLQAAQNSSGGTSELPEPLSSVVNRYV